MSSYCLVQFALHASKRVSKLQMYNHNTIINEEDHGTEYTMPDRMID